MGSKTRIDPKLKSALLSMLAIFAPHQNMECLDMATELVPLGAPELGMTRGEMLEHSLTPVTQGLRQIVQIELCRAKVGRH